jgi:alpha-galactosidase
VPWYLGHDDERERLRIPVGDYLRVSEENLAEYEQVRSAVLAGQALELERDATEYAPQVIHALEAGTEIRIIANVPNRGLIDNLPAGFAVEVPCRVGPRPWIPSRSGRCPRSAPR